MTASTDSPLDLAAAPEPPWVHCPGQPPWWGGWRQGAAEPWYLEVFLPFWTDITAEQRVQYLAHWPPPDDDWAENLAANIRPRTLDVAAWPAPPWQRHPGRSPAWLGWRFGAPRRWLRDEFLPFWVLMRPHDQALYLRHWSPPTEAWRARLQRWNLSRP